MTPPCCLVGGYQSSDAKGSLYSVYCIKSCSEQGHYVAVLGMLATLFRRLFLVAVEHIWWVLRNNESTYKENFSGENKVWSAENVK
jgi:hypothetical protein